VGTESGISSAPRKACLGGTWDTSEGAFLNHHGDHACDPDYKEHVV
jgi:hypothetical protein